MNCKPGDLAVIVREANQDACRERILGRVVRVLSVALQSDFRLPDGRRSVGAPPGYWVIEFDRPVGARSTVGLEMESVFAVIGDFKLRPIRDPGDVQDETLDWLPVPQKEIA